MSLLPKKIHCEDAHDYFKQVEHCLLYTSDAADETVYV
jgi:hypothetical protein